MGNEVRAVSVVLEEVQGDYDPERWRVVGQSAGKAMIGVTAAEKLETGVQYILRLEGDFTDGDLVVLINQVARSEYWPYQVRTGQLIRLYNGCSPVQIGGWLFSCHDGTIAQGYYYLGLEEWGYFECLRHDWNPETHLEKSMEGLNPSADIRRNCLKGLRVVAQREEDIQRLERTLRRIHDRVGDLLGSDPEEHLLPLTRSRDPLVQHCGWGIVSWVHRVFELYEGAVSGLTLPQECLKPKERKQPR